MRLGESATANVHFVVHPPKGGTIREVDTTELERRLAEASRSWRDDFVSAAMAEYGAEHGSRLARTYGDSFPEAFKEDFTPAIGAADLGILDRLGDEGIDLRLYGPTARPTARVGSRCSGRAPRSPCRRCCRCCRRWGWRSSTSDRTS